jgi:hypothetical protein
MTRWKKVLLAGSTVTAMLMVTAMAASATTGGRAALRAAGTNMVLMAAAAAPSPQPNGGGGPASGPASGGIGPIQITVADRWTLQGQLLAKGSVTITCGPFLSTEFSSAQVTVEEALGDKVGHANGSIQSLTCDGAKHTYPVTTLVADVPFRTGDGAISVFANACGVPGPFVGEVCQQGNALTTITVKQ